MKICLPQRKAIATLQINTVGQIYNKVIIPLHFVHLLSEMWPAEGVRREGERAQQLVFMREGLKSKGWASSKTWLSCAICHSGTRLPLDPALPFPAVPHQRFAATFVWHKFCTRKQSNTQRAVGGVTFYEHAMHILIKWQAEWQTNCQPACSALAWPALLWQAGDCAYYANMQGKLIRSAGATVSAKSKTKRGVCAISTESHRKCMQI